MSQERMCGEASGEGADGVGEKGGEGAGTVGVKDARDRGSRMSVLALTRR